MSDSSETGKLDWSKKAELGINKYDDFYKFYLVVFVGMLLLASLVAGFGGVIPASLLSREELISLPPIVEFVSKPAWTTQACDEGFEEVRNISLSPIDVPTACLCPSSAFFYRDSVLLACHSSDVDHGCLQLDAFRFPSLPFWEDKTYSRLCIRRGGTPLVSLAPNGSFSIRPTYDPSDPTSACPPGFRKCGRGICFDRGIPCPVISIRRGLGGAYSPVHAALGLNSHMPMVSVGFEDIDDDGGRLADSFRSIVPAFFCKSFIPTLPPDFSCHAGDELCRFYENPSCSFPDWLSTPSPRRYVFRLHREMSKDVSPLEGTFYADYPTSLPFVFIFAPVLLVLFVILLLCTAVPIHDRVSFWMKDLWRNLWRHFISTLVGLLILLAHTVSCIYYANWLKEQLPPAMFYNDSDVITTLSTCLYIYLVLILIFSTYIFLVLKMATYRSANFEHLWNKEVREHEKRAREEKRKKIQTIVSTMSSETKQFYLSALASV